jgi:RimJ/RimL family protein N-acetyltransferase
MADIRERSLADPAPEPHGQGLRLRVWDPESEHDVETWLRGRTDPDFRRWNTPLILEKDLTDARESLASHVQNAVNGTGMPFCVTDEATGETLGHVSIGVVNRPLRVGRVGYWTLPEARGRGVATRALALATRWAFAELGLNRLELDHAVGHEASCRIAERCGFRYEGTLRGAMWETGRHDTFRDCHLHARLATDPEPGSEPQPAPGPGAAEAAFTTVAPVVPVRNLDAALDRYRRLGFAAHAYDGPDRYGFVERGSVSVHLSEWSEHDPRRTGAVIYLYVSDADAVYAEWKNTGVEGRFTEPEERPYRLREFTFVDADGTAHRVGSPRAAT